MPKLASLKTTIAIFLSFIFPFINQPCYSRTLNNNIPTHDLNHSHLHKITFLMPHILNTTSLTHLASSANDNNNFPFSSKPLTISPPSSESPGRGHDNDPTRFLDVTSSMGFLFPKKATLQDLELGKTTLIQQELLQQVDGTLRKFGTAEGVYVGRLEDNNGSGYMMALTVNFDEDDDDDGLRIFGEQRSDVIESHVVVIGGTGKYEDANGYASVKVVQRVGFSQQHRGEVTSSMLLSFDVYLI
ncbi:hypothetical protein QN277_011242 [Acacia crassicarpa]|uniref:Dirigent protein n=1 Tax=Acacia crassicarpa TaxID=499986 RepID=A0AAE1MYH6_9FABA|nr:hypothetical protein QN277_011242 [Acacia crassicarpa]